MYAHNPVLWTEGMLLRPQHFQQQDRHVTMLLRRSLAMLRGHAWGLARFEIDHGALETGRIEVRACTGLMPDGTLFSAPDDAEPPPGRALDDRIGEATVHLAVAAERSAALAAGGQESAAGARHDSRDAPVYDTTPDSAGGQERVQVAHMKLRLVVDGEDMSGLVAIPALRVARVGANRRIELDKAFIPTCLDHRVSGVLMASISEIEGLVHQSADMLAAIAAGEVDNTVAAIRDILLLEALNRTEPLLTHLARGNGMHPEQLFMLLLSLAGELATFVGSDSRRPEPFPDYRHHDLKSSFLPLFERLRIALREGFQPTAIEIRLEERRTGIRSASVDRTLLAEADLVFQINAAIDQESLARAFRAQAKAGPPDRVRELVTLALPGAPLRALPMAPKEVPPDRRALFFQIDRSTDLGSEIDRAGGIGIFVPGGIPEFRIRLWAIKR